MVASGFSRRTQKERLPVITPRQGVRKSRSTDAIRVVTARAWYQRRHALRREGNDDQGARHGRRGGGSPLGDLRAVRRAGSGQGPDACAGRGRNRSTSSTTRTTVRVPARTARGPRAGLALLQRSPTCDPTSRRSSRADDHGPGSSPTARSRPPRHPADQPPDQRLHRRVGSMDRRRAACRVALRRAQVRFKLVV